MLARRGQIRAERSVKPELREAVVTSLHKLISKAALVQAEHVHSDLQPCVFAVAQGQVTINVERARAPTFRFLTAGSRQVIAMKSTAVREYMRSKGLQMVGPDSARQFVEGMTKDTVDGFIAAGHKIWHVTAGPGDGVMLPLDTMFFEKIVGGGNNDCAGVRVSGWLFTDEDDMAALSKWLVSQGRPNVMLQNALDFVASRVAD